MDSENQYLLFAFRSLNEDEEIALKVGKRIVELLEEAKFKIEWDGSLNRRICIQNFQWDKQFDSELVSTERAIKVIKECNSR